ncbi:angiopoietin-1-like [Anopheles ziemanni]|uniref:angiopoietin-1-like n=1 Tax=Anopheles coustani TaxID=139045 RepID=UPI002658FC6C|nr:angiopoietin-1-like [Anopheles coustani]XP_058177065.1 angiopoietin-1-like [Anopheles ziemanni]
MAVGGNELEQLMSKLDALKDKLKEVEYSVKNSIKVMDLKLMSPKLAGIENNNEGACRFLQETEQRMEKTYAKLEQDMKERDVTLQMKLSQLGTNMQTMDSTLQEAMKQGVQNLKSTEAKYLSKFDELENKLISKTNNVEQHRNDLENVATVAAIEYTTQVDDIVHPIYSCRQVTNISGTYLLRSGEDSEPFEVFCEQTKFDGGWTVIQHRYDGSVDFYRNWTEYRNGFGNVDGEFWLGLEYMHQMTKSRSHDLIVEVKDLEGNYGYARYDEFEIGSEAEYYALKKLGAYSGTAGDSMSFSRDTISGT